MFFVLGYKSQLEELERTVKTVQAVLRDAEAKQDDLSEQAQLYIEELNDAVYDADDLLDEFITLAERKKNKFHGSGGKFSKKVSLFLNQFKDLTFARNISHGVKEIRKRSDGIAKNHNDFGFKLDHQPIRKRREDTCSYIYQQDIIGREDDREKIVGMLLNSHVQHDLSCLTIVGIGGLGKTTLAQLVYNEARIEEEFPLRFWVCVSDENKNHLDVKSILGKILGKRENVEMEDLQRDLRERVGGRKYLLVLDDVWNESRDEWLEFVKYFMGSARCSWIVVTTRSKETARIVGNGHTYELEILSEENSWLLFEKTAFEDGQVQLPDLVEIGREIVRKCADVPLAIRVVGSLLYGQGMNKWKSFQKMGLGKIRHGSNDILPILKLSYLLEVSIQ